MHARPAGPVGVEQAPVSSTRWVVAADRSIWRIGISTAHGAPWAMSGTG
jgi:hypothetical protein